MKIKVSDLEGAQLDYWVAQALGERVELREDGRCCLEGVNAAYDPSTDWCLAGPIIQQNIISLTYSVPLSKWYASLAAPSHCFCSAVGETPLIAAMRMFVILKWGSEFELEELKTI